jgi:hypothetical protein
MKPTLRWRIVLTLVPLLLLLAARGSGTGLGLAIVQEIVAAHGGTITCESQPGVGTTFRLRLPLASRVQGSGFRNQGSGVRSQQSGACLPEP